jgi:hypothetical protein
MDMTAHGHAHPKKAVHNMALVGDHHVFLSHLPMFMAPHNAQVLLDAAFTKDGKNVDAMYFADRAANPTVRFYTVQPELFVLRELFQSGPAPQRTSFKATVFRGHLEKGGVPIDALTDIDVHVTRVIHAHSFEGSKQPTLTYVMFGSPHELHMAHLVSGAPDFDQLLAVSGTGSMPSAEELLRGVTVEIVDRPNESKSRLQAKETIPARAHVTGAHQFLDVKLTVRAEQYFEEGELSSTRKSGALFDETKEEQKAGFD